MPRYWRCAGARCGRCRGRDPLDLARGFIRAEVVTTRPDRLRQQVESAQAVCCGSKEDLRRADGDVIEVLFQRRPLIVYERVDLGDHAAELVAGLDQVGVRASHPHAHAGGELLVRRR